MHPNKSKTPTIAAPVFAPDDAPEALGSTGAGAGLGAVPEGVCVIVAGAVVSEGW